MWKNLRGKKTFNTDNSSSYDSYSYDDDSSSDSDNREKLMFGLADSKLANAIKNKVARIGLKSVEGEWIDFSWGSSSFHLDSVYVSFGWQEVKVTVNANFVLPYNIYDRLWERDNSAEARWAVERAQDEVYDILYDAVDSTVDDMRESYTNYDDSVKIYINVSGRAVQK